MNKYASIAAFERGDLSAAIALGHTPERAALILEAIKANRGSKRGG